MKFQKELDCLLMSWEKTYVDKRFPRFDYKQNTPPNILVLLESPGPEVKNSEKVSFENDDPTAKELRRLLGIAGGDAASRTLLWNAIPWFLDRPPRTSDIDDAKKLHDELLTTLRPNIDHVILLGEWARKLLPYYSPRVGNARIYGGHHTGNQAQIQKKGLLTQENEAVFKLLKSTNRGS